jgi:hypothetical protein
VSASSSLAGKAEKLPRTETRPFTLYYGAASLLGARCAYIFLQLVYRPLHAAEINTGFSHPNNSRRRCGTDAVSASACLANNYVDEFVAPACRARYVLRRCALSGPLSRRILSLPSGARRPGQVREQGTTSRRRRVAVARSRNTCNAAGANRMWRVRAGRRIG